MNNSKEKKNIERVGPRSPTEAGITCRPYASSGATRASDGVMRNFSNGGYYMETSNNHKLGTILIMRMVRYPPHAVKNGRRRAAAVHLPGGSQMAPGTG